MTRNAGPGPSPSEQTLFAIWDAIERARTQHGERTAQQLARKALAAVVPPTEQKEQPK